MTALDDIIALLRNFDGISRKFVLPRIISKLRMKSYGGDQPYSLGEDSAAIGTESTDFVLHTTDAIVEELCLHHPRAAGFNVVLANVMDIYAAGGKPTSFAVALSYSDPEIGEAILEGLIEGSHSFRVPVVRGHTNPSSESTYVVGSATGTIKKEYLITAGGAQPGDVLVILFDRAGQRGSSYKLGWDSVTGRSADMINKRLSVMNHLAEEKVLHASKDVSVAGVVGTAGMMLEYSGCGGIVEIEALDSIRPDSVSLDDWLRMFISLGFLVSTPKENLERVKSIAEEHGMFAAVVGLADSTQVFRLKWKDDERTMFDYTKGPVLTPKGNS